MGKVNVILFSTSCIQVSTATIVDLPFLNPPCLPVFRLVLMSLISSWMLLHTFRTCSEIPLQFKHDYFAPFLWTLFLKLFANLLSIWRYPTRCVSTITQITLRVSSDTTFICYYFSNTTCFDQTGHPQVFILYKNIKLKVKT